MSATTTVELPIPSTQAQPGKKKRRLVLFAGLALPVAAAGAGYRSYWVEVLSRYVSTDNAYTAAETATITSQVEGRVAEVRVVDSQKVSQG